MDSNQAIGKLIHIHNILSKVSVQGRENVTMLNDCFSLISQFIEELNQLNVESEEEQV